MAVAKTSTRRRPEVSRDLIVEAAARVFARELPDRVGVREIAAEAGVSHGLIAHHFGSYDGLIDEVVERRLSAMRALAFARLGSTTFAPSESPLLDVLLELLDDPTLTRLIAWSLLSGDTDRVMGKHAMLGKVIDGMHVRLAGAVSRPRLEMSVLLTISTVAGWSLAGAALERAAGRAPYTREELRTELGRMIRAYVTAP